MLKTRVSADTRGKGVHQKGHTVTDAWCRDAISVPSGLVREAPTALSVQHSPSVKTGNDGAECRGRTI